MTPRRPRKQNSIAQKEFPRRNGGGVILSIRSRAERGQSADRWRPNPADETNGSGVTIFELGHGDCRWPLEGNMFCGAPSLVQKSYCKRHADRAFQKDAFGNYRIMPRGK